MLAIVERCVGCADIRLPKLDQSGALSLISTAPTVITEGSEDGDPVLASSYCGVSTPLQY